MSLPREDWAAVLERLLGGDRLALLQLSRLVNGFLARWNAYDFRDEWDDVIQEVVLAAGLAMRGGKLRSRGAVIGYLRTTARHKFLDRLETHLRCGKREIAWEAVLDGPLEPIQPDAEAARGVREALARLPENRREAVTAVYLEGKSYEEAARDTGIPLGSLKRYLRDGLAQLRSELVLPGEKR
jgi:RNA polymerase sigma-70 factor (ECF subfamily)